MVTERDKMAHFQHFFAAIDPYLLDVAQGKRR